MECFHDAGYVVYGSSRQGGIKDPRVKSVVLDVRDDESCQEAVRLIIAESGRLDLLINNAGMGVSGPVELIPEQDTLEQVDANLLGCLRMSRAALPYLRETGGRILNVGSVAASAPIPFQALYSASKAAVRTLSLALDSECRPLGVRSLCIEFGDMKTGFTAARKKSGSGDSVYAKRCEKSVARMEEDEQSGMDPSVGAKLLLRVAQAHNPKPVTVCGISYKLVTLLIKLTPVRFSQWILGLMYG